MRIAITTWSSRAAGGVETYLSGIIPELVRAGHELAFCAEVDEPSERQQIELPAGVTAWCVANIGSDQAITNLKAWRPDIIYAHKISDPKLEKDLLSLAPSVFFAHDYQGTCISGTKTLQFPVAKPCERQFGRQCLLQYFPRRCGGLNPATMLQLYSLQSARQQNLHSYDAIVTHSSHMVAELGRHGLSAESVYTLAKTDYETSAKRNGNNHVPRSPLNLVFSGRLEYLKGVHLLIDALPQAAKHLGPLKLTIAGDGRERNQLERRAERVRSSTVAIEFRGWLAKEELQEVFEHSELLVVPSLWPEPFGMVGIEAAQFGVPAAAFDVGGIRDWLLDGTNGFLASGAPPTSQGLAEAIIKCLRDREEYERLRAGAFEVAQRFSIGNHVTALLAVFSKVIDWRRQFHPGASENPARHVGALQTHSGKP